jgi:hypothetical protein
MSVPQRRKKTVLRLYSTTTHRGAGFLMRTKHTRARMPQTTNTHLSGSVIDRILKSEYNDRAELSRPLCAEATTRRTPSRLTQHYDQVRHTLLRPD